MASLLGLANETILQIIDESRPDGIWGLVGCCKRIWILGADDLKQHRQDIARYREPSLPLFQKEEEPAFGVDKFLSDILHQPRRALYVDHLYLFDFDAFVRDPVLSTKERLDVLDKIRNQFFNTNGCPYNQDDEVGKWVDKFERGDMNAVLCLSLTLLPNLRTLAIDDDQMFADLIYTISKYNQSPYLMISGPLPLSKLETVTINGARTVNQIGERLGIYEACMTLPSLRRLRGTSITFAFDRWPANEDFSSELRVTEIYFGESAINANAFTRILTRAQSLERLTYKSVGRHGISGDLTCISLKNVLEQHSARTLTHLDLDFKDTSWELRGRSIGSLSRLRAHKHLRIEPSIFIDDDSLGLVDLLPLLPSSL